MEYTCNKCFKIYLKPNSLRRHVKQSHPDEIKELAPLPNRKFNCKFCPKSYNNKKGLSKHERTLHNVEYIQLHKTYYDCPLCKKKHFAKSRLFEHFTKQHDIFLEVSETTFETFQEFEVWKEEIQLETKSKFVKNGNGGCSSKRKTKFIYYICHRSGQFTNRKNRKRNMKNQGSNKINGVCPASLTVKIEESGTTSVRFVQTHVGHDNDLGHLTLSVNERKEFAKKIASNVPFHVILDEVRESVSQGEIQRVHLLTQRDLSNIEKSFKLNTCERKDENDAISVNAWVCELRDKKDCILFYKPQEQCCETYPALLPNDFVLIIMNNAQIEMLQKYGKDALCIDGTHGLNKYDFELVTLLVLDELRQGFPCAFLITNRCDQDVLSVFFNCIKQKSGIIRPNVFMSDMANCFFNAFISTMSVPTYRLFCIWHVDKAWRKNLSKINLKEKQVETYKLLRTLMEETDKNAFQKMLTSAVNQLIEDPVTLDFGIYFHNEYVKCVSSWAFCYRLNCGLNTNMHLEAMHKTIKYVYFLGKNTKRLDKMICTLMKFVRDRLYDRIITLYKGKITKKVADLRIRHKNSEYISDRHIIEDTDGWLIQSSNGLNMYSVQRISEQCDCKLRCQECKTCIHIFSCSCIDYSIKWNMCKHIHLLCQHLGVHESNTLMDVASTEAEITFLSAEVSKNKIKPHISLDELISDLNLEWMNQITHMIKSKQHCKVIKDHFTAIKAKLEAIDEVEETPCPQLKGSCAEDRAPHNKKIIQQRLFSTKKKKEARTSKLVVSKPTNEEERKITMLLLNNT